MGMHLILVMLQRCIGYGAHFAGVLFRHFWMIWWERCRHWTNLERVVLYQHMQKPRCIHEKLATGHVASTTSVLMFFNAGHNWASIFVSSFGMVGDEGWSWTTLLW
jgi:hypothetical protein